VLLYARRWAIEPLFHNLKRWFGFNNLWQQTRTVLVVDDPIVRVDAHAIAQPGDRRRVPDGHDRTMRVGQPASRPGWWVSGCAANLPTCTSGWPNWPSAGNSAGQNR
jgi:hypothetical protein